MDIVQFGMEKTSTRFRDAPIRQREEHFGGVDITGLPVIEDGCQIASHRRRGDYFIAYVHARYVVECARLP